MKQYTLIGHDGLPYKSATKGTLGGYRRGKYRLYGRLDCKNALMHFARGGYVQFRVFFSDEKTAVAAGYRACGKCMPDKYKEWKSRGG